MSFKVELESYDANLPEEEQVVVYLDTIMVNIYVESTIEAHDNPDCIYD